jgi:hypothetical protein
MVSRGHCERCGKRGPVLDPVNLNRLIAELLGIIHMLTGYPVPEQAPPVRLAPLAQMQAMVCRGPCQVRGFYLPESGVFVNEVLDLQQDVVARSVLLHELVHHVQHVTRKYDNLSSCERWFFREREAYDVQNAYLRQQQAATRFAFETVPAMCSDSTLAR